MGSCCFCVLFGNLLVNLFFICLFVCFIIFFFLSHGLGKVASDFFLVAVLLVHRSFMTTKRMTDSFQLNVFLTPSGNSLIS